MRKQLLSLSFIALLLSGCVFDDLSDCPAGGTMELSLRYEQPGTPSATLPIVRADFYIFDADRRFVCLVSDTNGPFPGDYRRETELPAGDYTVVAWGSADPSVYTMVPYLFFPGTTMLDDTRLMLASLPDTRGTTVSSAGPTTPLYHAMTTQVVHVSEGKITDVTLPLYRNTKDINLLVSFLHEDGTSCDDPSHQQLDACIRSSDGVLSFENITLPCAAFDYVAARRDVHTGGFDALFRKMTLRLDTSDKPEIILSSPGITPSDDPVIFYRESLMKLLQGTGYTTQAKLDGTDTYNIELRFICQHIGDETYATIGIWVNGWAYVDISDDV